MAEPKGIKFDTEALNKISEDFVKTRKDISELDVVVDKFNDIDPLIVIRAVNGTKMPDVGELCSIAELLFDGSTITFYHKDTVVNSLIYARGNGNKLALCYKDQSYLLDKLLDVTYAILLKKSTPQ